MNINSINFGKTPVMKCVVKDVQKKQPINATLFQMDPFKSSDLFEVQKSKNTGDILYDFMYDNRVGATHRKYYVLKNDNTEEVISCAETSNHYSFKESPLGGRTLLVEELSGNKKYLNAQEPMMTYLINEAKIAGASAVVTAFDTDKTPNMSQIKPIQYLTGEFVVPQTHFDNALEQGEKRYNISYEV